MLKIAAISVPVDDQARAVDYYTNKLGFAIKNDIPLGEARWLTVVDPRDPDGVELVLEPDAHPAVQAYKQALVTDGIPLTFFTVDDLAAAHAELANRGVTFTQEPIQMGPNKVAIFDDTCGNLIQLVQVGAP